MEWRRKKPKMPATIQDRFLCRKAHVSFSAYGIKHKCSSATAAAEYAPVSSAELAAGIAHMTLLGAARGVKPAP